jgi:Flp pilus assembly protein TadG
MRTKQRGASAIEFAIVLPLLLLVVDGVMEFGMLAFDKVMITHAAREAVRAGVVLSSPKLTSTDIALVASNYCQHFLLSFGSTQGLQVVANQSSDGASQTPLRVSISFTYTSLLYGGTMAAIQRPIVLTSQASGFNE